MASPLSLVNFVGFEEGLSGDLVRMQRLASREAQNILEAASRSDENRDNTLGYVGPSSVNSGGSPISFAEILPYLRFAGAFTMELGAGQAYDERPPASTADDSAYTVLRWPTQVLPAFANPDGTNPRIDLVVAEAASANADLVSRNILLDPANRTVQAQVIAKTNNPLSNISIVTGTAASSPTAPSVPSGKIALFEVWVPAAAPDASTFVPIRRLWRRPAYPFTAFNGIISGCVPRWSDVDDTTTTSQIDLSDTDVHRVCVDGEVLVFRGTVPVAVDDTANSPGTAGATDKPFYIYLCGGRNNPRRSSSGCPFVLVMSTTAPDAFGHPSAALNDGATIQRGGAVYIGVGWVFAGSTRKRACYVSNDEVFPARSVLADTAAVAVSAGVTDFTLATKPVPSTMATVLAVPSGTTTPYVFNIFPRFSGSAPAIGRGQTLSDGTVEAKIPARIPIGATTPHVKVQTSSSTGTILIAPIGYNMNVPRLAFGLA